MAKGDEKRERIRLEFYRKRVGLEAAKRIMKFKQKARRHREYLLITQKICQKCGTDKVLTVDHIIPVAVTKKKRRNDLSNKQLLCRQCNLAKGCDVETAS